MEKFALIGKTLKHSYSKKIHRLLGDYCYDLVEVAPEKLNEFANSKEYKGFNITIPYKKDIMPYLDKIDDRAKKIGAVNTVVERDNKLLGFNTDFDGMVYMLNRAGITVNGKNVLILGSGGTANTSQAVCEYLSAKSIKVLSRTGEINYDNYFKLKDIEIVINATPVGMYPNNYECLIDLSHFEKLKGVVDVVYNPKITMLLYQAKKLGVKYTNGFSMLVAQAKYAAEHFTGQKIKDDVIEKVITELEKETTNVVLIGMPGCGKTTVGERLAKELNLEFIDIDQEIVRREGVDIPTIFTEKGEEYFREKESEVIKDIGKLNGKVISTGGGAVKREENYFPLKQNGIIFWIDRSIEKLSQEGRPLSKDLATVKKLYSERKELYKNFADYKIDNDKEIELAVKGVIDKL